MVQIEPVGDASGVAEGPKAECPGQCRARQFDSRGDHCRRAEGDDEETALVQQGAVTAYSVQAPEERGGSGQADHGDPALACRVPPCGPAGLRPGRRIGHARTRRPGSQGHDDREHGPDHDRLGPGIGPVVETVDRGARQVQPGAQGGGCRADDARSPTDPPAPEPAQHEQGDQRPDEVELLLHRQRPRVQEWREGAETDEVVLARGDEMPVGGVDEGEEGVTAELGGWNASTDPACVRADADQQDEERGEQAAGPATPELDQLDGARAGVLGEQQGGDEVPREDEEHVDAEEPPVDRPESCMEAHHRQDGHPAQPVEPRNEPEGSRLRGAIRGPRRLARSRTRFVARDDVPACSHSLRVATPRSRLRLAVPHAVTRLGRRLPWWTRVDRVAPWGRIAPPRGIR